MYDVLIPKAHLARKGLAMFPLRVLYLTIICSLAAITARSENVVQAAINAATTPAHRRKAMKKTGGKSDMKVKLLNQKQRMGHCVSR